MLVYFDEYWVGEKLRFKFYWILFDEIFIFILVYEVIVKYRKIIVKRI